MNKILKNNLGVSPVVATVMLTLIAVVAASTFALFVAQKQEDIQEAERNDYMRSLENLQITGINDFNISKKYINISVSSLHSRDSEVYFFVNGNIATNKSHPSFNISSFRSVDINLTESVNLQNNSPITIRMVTKDWLNSFERTFFPPVALVDIDTHSEFDGSVFTYYYILDGSSSYCLQDEVYIVNWTWEYTNISGSQKDYGQKVRANEIDFNENITLSIRDNMGMKAECVAKVD